MTEPLRVLPNESATTCRYGTADDFAIEEFFDGIVTVLGGAANVVMQLALQPVAYGVMESDVDSGRADLHPWKRLRTTLTYLSVALMGDEADKADYRAEVNRVHRSIRSTAGSPVKYNAFDPQLQKWVAACLYWGVIDLKEKMHGPLDEATADVFYRYASSLGTTLQMRPEMWPATRAEFDEYWRAGLERHEIDAATVAYFDHLIDLRMLARPLRLAAPIHRFIVTGLLPPHVREQLGMTWTDRDEQRFLRLFRMIGSAQRRLPQPARLFPMNTLLWDMRRRRRRNMPLV
ncbi:DUF2236 domain-containing protein [Nocardia sp. 2]|uniref:DUF2236 domain-containing protein n=1 Tax=Nocardia acididurans TaxID=2802282 RepID=A0ABS1M0W1_9NOCA|nr:oxygenase MpaB family protein [Nocardia acididurans]MBL1074165.1 DUF2236 domain-containing protein [Nocardia acididurans]